METLPDIGLESRVDKRDIPIGDVSTVKADVTIFAGQPEVVRQPFLVIDEVLFDEISAVPQAQNELCMSEMRVVFHEVPDDRPEADVDHRFGYAIRILPQPRAEAAAKEYDFHCSFRPR